MTSSEISPDKVLWVTQVLGVAFPDDIMQGAALRDLAGDIGRRLDDLRDTDEATFDVLSERLAEIMPQLGAPAAEMQLQALDTVVNTVLTAEAGTDGIGSAFSKVGFEVIHLEWEAAKKQVAARLATLHDAIIDDIDDIDDEEGQTAAAKLAKIVARFNMGLGDTLDAFRQAETPQEKARLAAEARRIAGVYADFLATDALVAHVENNPYAVVVDAPALLGAPLNRLGKELAKAGL